MIGTKEVGRAAPPRAQAKWGPPVATIFATRLMAIFLPLPLQFSSILQRLSSAVKGHPAFEGSWPNLQLRDDLDLGQAAVHHATAR